MPTFKLSLFLSGPPDQAITCPPANVSLIIDTLKAVQILSPEGVKSLNGLNKEDEILFPIRDILRDSTREGFEVLIYYSGHAATGPRSSPSRVLFSKIGNEKYSWRNLLEEVANNPEIPHVTVILDCCHASALIIMVKEMHLSHRISVFASSGEIEMSYQPPGQETSLFTQCFCDLIDGSDAETPMTLTDVYDRLRLQMKEQAVHSNVADQNPEILVTPSRKEVVFLQSLESDPGMDEFFANYPKTISKEIREDRQLGILLSADELWAKYHNSNVFNASFELASGSYAKEFLTLWELFDHRETFGLCITWLAEAARRFFVENQFSCIVTCTDTARELGRYIRSSLYNSKIDVPLCHLGYPPSIVPLTVREQWLVNSNCLILTDVIATGDLGRRIISELDNDNGNISGVLAFAMTGKENILKYHKNKVFPDSPGSKSIPLRYLAEVPIETFGAEKASSYTIPIDHNVVLPRLSRDLFTEFKPLVDRKTMLKQFDDSNAISCGFFTVDEQPVLSYIDLKKVIEMYGTDFIWPQILELFNDEKRTFPLDRTKAVVVSTYKEGDILFRNFFHDHLCEHLGVDKISCLTIKRHTRDDDVIFESVGPYSVDMEGMDLLVVLGTSSTTEKIRSIAGLLATKKPRSVTIVALLSRAGVCSSEFLSKISKLSPIDTMTNTLFSYSSVYSLREIDDVRLGGAYSKLAQFFNDYGDFTELAIFRRMASQITEDFSFKSIDRRSVNSRHSEVVQQLPDSVLKTLDSRISQAVYEYSVSGEFKELLNILEYSNSPKFVRVILIVILSDLSRLEISGTVKKTISVISKKIDRLRSSRIEIEGNDRKPYTADTKYQVSQIFELEMVCFECLAILRKFVSKVEERLALSEILTSCISLDQWNELPLNRALVLNNPRLYFCFSISRFSSEARVKNLKASREYTEDLRVAVRFLETLSRQSRESLERSKGIPLTSQGAFPDTGWIIENTIDEIDCDRKHNYLNLASHLGSSRFRIAEDGFLVQHRKVKDWIKGQALNRAICITSGDSGTLGLLGGAFSSQNALFQTAASLRNLIQMSPYVATSQRYIMGVRQQGLLFDILALDLILSEAIATSWLPATKALDFLIFFDRVKEDFGPNGTISRLIDTLFSPLNEILSSAAFWCKERLVEKNVASEALDDFTSSIAARTDLQGLMLPVCSQSASRLVRGMLWKILIICLDKGSLNNLSIRLSVFDSLEKGDSEVTDVEVEISYRCGSRRIKGPPIDNDSDGEVSRFRAVGSQVEVSNVVDGFQALRYLFRCLK